MKNLRTIILAAGKGTRMNSSTPKVLHQVCGYPIIQYVLNIANGMGSQKTYIVVGHKSDALREYIDDDVVAAEQKKLLGTADAVKTVERHFKSYSGDVLVLCGDTPLLKKEIVKSVIRRHKKANAACTLLTTVVHNPQGYGRIIRKENGQVVSIREDKDAVGYERDIAEINVGVYCFKAQSLFKALKEIKLNKKKGEFYLTDVIELFAEQGQKVESVETEDPSEGLGVNTREDLAVAEAILRKRILKNLMTQGVTIQDPSTTYIDADVKIGKDTIIRPFTFIENDVKIGEKCIIGPYSRLRTGTKLGNNVEIGNFTEVSRTKIGDKTFMKHFSFLGDSVVGNRVNIGAGTVTANFDGTEKHSSRIMDGAFIGSDSVLVAPVRIGKKAVVGAGSVVTKGKTIPDGGVVVGVPAVITNGKKRK